MSFRRFLGLEDKESGGVALSMGNVVLPLDLALEMVFRQQNQLFAELGNLKMQLGVSEQIMTGMAENATHMHEHIVELRQALEGATTHPVEKVDEQTEAKKEDPEKKKKNLIN